MAINVVAGSASITVKPHPSVRAPFVNGANMSFTSNQITIHGECQITGAAGDNPTGWTLGLIQLKWISTDWAFYRGQTNADGSLFEQAARPPARPTQGCRDTITAGAIFVDNNPGKDRTVATAMSGLPFTMTAEFSDAPSRHWPLTRVNSKTRKPTFIREAQSEAHFCTVLSLKSPANVFHHLKCVYWNVHWQGTFLPSNFANLAAPWSIVQTGGALGNMSAVSQIIDGAPTDHRFSGIVTAAGAPHCNTLVRHALAAPNIKESNVWENFDVTR
jgi:hypothetical protein